MPARRLYSWRDGIGSLPLALAGGLGPALRTGVTVRRIGRAPGGFRIDAGTAGTIAARAVVVATQPHVAAGLLEVTDPAAAEAAASIGAPPLAVVFLGYPRRRVAHPLDGLGYLVPSAEGRDLSGVLFCSTMFPGRAPAGHVALAAYIGGARSPDLARLAPAGLIDLARREFGDLLGARGEPAVARVRQWPRGLPQYRLGHGDLVAGLRATPERCPGLYVTGNYLSGVSVRNCVAEASRTSLLVTGISPARLAVGHGPPGNPTVSQPEPSGDTAPPPPISPPTPSGRGVGGEAATAPPGTPVTGPPLAPPSAVAG